MKYFVVIASFMAVLGCDDGCNVEETRCSGNVAQVCNSSQNWEVMDDCDDVGEGTPFDFTCEFDDELNQHVCVPDLGGLDGGVDGGE